MDDVTATFERIVRETFAPRPAPYPPADNSWRDWIDRLQEDRRAMSFLTGALPTITSVAGSTITLTLDRPDRPVVGEWDWRSRLFAMDRACRQYLCGATWDAVYGIGAALNGVVRSQEYYIQSPALAARTALAYQWLQLPDRERTPSSPTLGALLAKILRS